jgi:uroporphyrinogen decarboxylase
VRALGPNGGYILAPCSNFQPDTPPENVLAMIEAARTAGRYSV